MIETDMKSSFYRRDASAPGEKGSDKNKGPENRTRKGGYCFTPELFARVLKPPCSHLTAFALCKEKISTALCHMLNVNAAR